MSAGPPGATPEVAKIPPGPKHAASVGRGLVSPRATLMKWVDRMYVKYGDGEPVAEGLYDEINDPYEMNNLAVTDPTDTELQTLRDLAAGLCRQSGGLYPPRLAFLIIPQDAQTPVATLGTVPWICSIRSSHGRAPRRSKISWASANRGSTSSARPWAIRNSASSARGRARA